jgi:hypothetical protein
VEKTSRLRSRNPVASEVKCGPHGGMNSKMKSWTVSRLSLKTKVKPGLCGSRVMSEDWWRLHRVHGVCSGSPENYWVTRLSHKTEAEDSTRRCGRLGRFNHPGGAVRPPGAGQIARAGLTTQGGGLTALAAGAEKLRSGGRVGIARPASRLSRLRSPGIRPMKKFQRLPNPPLRGLYP